MLFWRFCACMLVWTEPQHVARALNELIELMQNIRPPFRFPELVWVVRWFLLHLDRSDFSNSAGNQPIRNWPKLPESKNKIKKLNESWEYANLNIWKEREGGSESKVEYAQIDKVENFACIPPLKKCKFQLSCHQARKQFVFWSRIIWPTKKMRRPSLWGCEGGTRGPMDSLAPTH